MTDPALLCREAERKAEGLLGLADASEATGLDTPLSPTALRKLASLLSQLAAVARAAGART